MNINNFWFGQGNLGSDIEFEFTPSGVMKGGVSLATKRRGRGEDGEYTNLTEWIRLKFVGGVATRANNFGLAKGSKVLVSGYLHTYSWEDKDGKRQYSWEIVVEDFEFLGGPKNESQSGDGSPATATVEADDEDDFPF